MIDDCPYTFKELTERMPALMEQMKQAIRQARPMSDFARRRKGAITIARELGRQADFAGCYVFLDNGKPIYTGISRKVISRVRMHTQGPDDAQSTLAYKMTCKAHPHSMTRKQAMRDDDFLAAYRQILDDVKSLDVAFIEVEDTIELHLFEVFCAMALDTEWNSFRTH